MWQIVQSAMEKRNAEEGIGRAERGLGLGTFLNRMIREDLTEMTFE